MNSIQNEWLELETATEVIGQMMAYYVARSAQQQSQVTADSEALAKWEQVIYQLSQERKACYRAATRQAMIEKALTVYGPFLKRLDFSK